MVVPLRFVDAVGWWQATSSESPQRERILSILGVWVRTWNHQHIILDVLVVLVLPCFHRGELPLSFVRAGDPQRMVHALRDLLHNPRVGFKLIQG